MTKNELKNQQIIFLDFDGVMITERGTAINKEDFGVTEDEFGTLFDDDAMETLKEIEQKASFSIVVTSNRRFVGLEQLRQMWKKRKLAGNILDITPLHAADDAIAHGESHQGKIKAIEIKAWLQSHPEVKRYIVVDDEPIEDAELQSHFIQCDPVWGLSDKIVEITESLLGTRYKPMPTPKGFNLLGEAKSVLLEDIKKSGILYKQMAQLPKIDMSKPFDFMEKVIQNTILLTEKGSEQVALAYGLAMLITMQTHVLYLYCRFDEFIGLLCSIAINLKEVELAKMLMRIMEGTVDLLSDVEDIQIMKEFYDLEEAIEAIPAAEVVDNRLVYFELICELRRHWVRLFAKKEK